MNYGVITGKILVNSKTKINIRSDVNEQIGFNYN